MEIVIEEAGRLEDEHEVLLHYRFQECDTCAAKPGTPTLCSGCVHNRTLIERYESMITNPKS